MARPHIEFVQCQNIAWQQGPDGTLMKLLNADPDSTAATMLIQYPAGWVAPKTLADAPAEEWFVLEGAVETDAGRHGRHAYAFRPAGAGGGLSGSRLGATLIMFRYAVGDRDTLAGVAEPIDIDTRMMPWDVSTYDPKLSHLRLARKVLRMGPNDSGRTFLLAGLPHGIPAVDSLPAETHRHCEEGFMIHGEIFAPEGVMRAGSYFFRPPGIVHGPHVSETGFFQLMRSPGANWIKTEWTDATYALPIDAAYAPVVPPGTPESWIRGFQPGSLF
jgi:hypothetical protein